MNRRISLWTFSGLLVACGWVLFFGTTAPHPYSERALWTFVDITAPASLLRFYPLKFYWFILLNGCAYAVLGLGTEMLRRTPLRHHSH